MADINDGILANDDAPRNVTDLTVVNKGVPHFIFYNTVVKAALLTHLPWDDHRGQSSVRESQATDGCHPPDMYRIFDLYHFHRT